MTLTFDPSSNKLLLIGLHIRQLCLCSTNLGFLLFSRKFSSRFEFGLSVLISLICVISGKVFGFSACSAYSAAKVFGCGSATLCLCGHSYLYAISVLNFLCNSSGLTPCSRNARKLSASWRFASRTLFSSRTSGQ